MPEPTQLIDPNTIISRTRMPRREPNAMTRSACPKVSATSPTQNHMPTSFLLLAQYGGRVMLTVEEVCRDFFSHLTPLKFLRKTVTGDIKLPVVRMDGSLKAARGVHVSDLADYLDGRRAAAKKEVAQITGRGLAPP